MKFAQRLFLVAGLYGLLALVPMYFMEGTIGRETPPEITHPEFFYGFVGVAIAWQLLFLILSRDPLRYRAMILPAIVEKLSFGVAVLLLWSQGRAAGAPVLGGCIDLILAVLFARAFILLGHTGPGSLPRD